MDPLSAVGLASSIVQLVDFTTKIVNGARQVYDSRAGAVAQNADIGLCAEELKALCDRVQADARPVSHKQDYEAFARLADRCVEVSSDLLVLFEKLKAKNPHSKWDCTLAAFKTQLKKTEREDLLARLSECRAQLDMQLARMRDLDNKSFQSKVLYSIQSHDAAFQQLLDRLRNLRENVTLSSFSPDAENQLRRLYELPETTHTIVTGRRILNILHFEAMHQRLDEICRPLKGTFSWAITYHDVQETSGPTPPEQIAVANTGLISEDLRKESPLECWLKPGTKLYWILGKPGSGKSTLMRYLYDYPGTFRGLKNWADGKTLMVGKAFLPGTTVSKLGGVAQMCRSLLYDILEQDPTLICQIFPELWQQVDLTPWQVEFKTNIRNEHLIEGLHRLFMDKDILTTRRFVLYIDGLDTENTAFKLLHDWVEMCPTDIKLCISSRSLPSFVDNMDNEEQLWMHHHTSDDLLQLSVNSLGPSLPGTDKSVQYTMQQPQNLGHQRVNDVSKLARNIVERADGDIRKIFASAKRLQQHREDPNIFGSDHVSRSVDSSSYLSDISDGSFAKLALSDEKGKFVSSSSSSSETWTSGTSTTSVDWAPPIAENVISPSRTQFGEEATHGAERPATSQMKELEVFLGHSLDFEEDLFVVEDARLNGTCEWFASSAPFMEWMDFDSTVPRLLWVTGHPGSGKSTLAGYAIDELKKRNAGCSFYFFKHADKSKSLLSTCLRAIALQMSRRYPSIREALYRIKGNSTVLGADQGHDRNIWHKLFLEGIFRTKLENQFWVIDGLDECESNEAVFRTILGNAEVFAPVRILVTSRETPALQSGFSQLGTQFRKESLSAKDTYDDLRLVVQSKSKALNVVSESMRAELIEGVLGKSNGSFLWTTLVLNELAMSYSEEEMRRVLEDIPRGMEPLYQRALEGISQSGRGKALAKCILTWTTCATRPLKVQELEYVLKIGLNETYSSLEASITTLCGQLVTIDKLGKIQLVHETAREFLLDEDLRSEFAIDKKKAHNQMAEICLGYLVGNDMKIPRSSRRVAQASSAKSRSAFSAYACESFSYHLSRTSGNTPTVLSSLKQFLRSNILTWIESVARSSNLAPLIQTSKHLNTFYDAYPAENDLKDVKSWISDLIRVSAKFGDALVASPAAIYTIIPAFCPSGSAINRIGFPIRRISVVGLNETLWGDCLSCIEFRTQVSCVCRGDNFFAVGTTSGIAVLYHAVTGQEYKTLHHGEMVNLLCIISSLGVLVCGGIKTITVWQIHTGEKVHTFEAPRRCISLWYSEGHLFAACDKNFIASWDLHASKTRQLDQSWDPEKDCPEGPLRRPPSAISISLEHKMLAAAYPGRSIILWDLDENSYYGTCGKKLTDGETSKHLVTALAFNPNQELELLAVSYLDGELVLLDPFRDDTLEVTRANCPKLAASPDGRLLAGAAGYGQIDIYEFESLQLLYRIRSSNVYIKQLEFSKDSLHLIDIRGSQCNVWEPPMHKVAGTESDENAHPIGGSQPKAKTKISSMLLPGTAESSTHIICGKENGTVCAYELQTGSQTSTLYQHKSRVHILGWISDRNVVVSIDSSNLILAWKVETSKRKEPILGTRIFHARLECGNTITHFVPSLDAQKFILSTRDSDHLWSFGKQKEECCRDSNASSIRKWLQHPHSQDHVLFVDGQTLRILSWSDWTEVQCIPMNFDNTQFQPKSLKSCTVIGKLGVLVELSDANGGTDNRGLTFIEISSIVLNSTNNTKAEETLNLTHTVANPIESIIQRLSSHIYHIIDMSNLGELVFIDKQSWVCSVQLHTIDQKHFSYYRHFFIPYGWYSGVRSVICATTRRNVLFARNDNVVIIRGGLDHNEIIVT